jgi:DNA polymerase/3'-5' exonuclease PolX
MKTIRLGTVTDFTFCSKWFYSPTGLIEDLTYCRDVKKILSTKHYFTGSNKHILQNPYLHRLAIYTGFKLEKVSKLVEDM